MSAGFAPGAHTTEMALEDLMERPMSAEPRGRVAVGILGAGESDKALAWPAGWRARLSDPEWREAVRAAIETRDVKALLKRCEMWVGLESHLRLRTRRKLFCAAPEGSAGWVDLGWPGALPSLDPDAGALAARLGSALGAALTPRFGFERKRYAYPDLSKGYQTTQKALCVWSGGVARWPGGSMALERAQIEEDAAKVKRGPEGFEMDFSRAGSPLLEVVSQAWRATPQEAAAAAKALWREAVHCGASEGLIEAGHFKTDVNVSLRPQGAVEMGLRVEAKGVGSFEFIEAAASDILWALAEELLGEAPLGQRAVGFDEGSGRCSGMRPKVDESGYKFLPDGDLRQRVAPAFEPAESWMASRERLIKFLGASEWTERVLSDPRASRFLARIPVERLNLSPQSAGSAARAFFTKAERERWEADPAGAAAALGWIMERLAQGGDFARSQAAARREGL